MPVVARKSSRPTVGSQLWRAIERERRKAMADGFDDEHSRLYAIGVVERQVMAVRAIFGHVLDGHRKL